MEMDKSFLPMVTACDNFPYDATHAKSYYELILPQDETPHGYIQEATVAKMPWTSKFKIHHDYPKKVEMLCPPETADITAAVNEAFAEVINTCVDQGIFHIINGMHSEPMAIVGAKGPVRLERFAAGLFGITITGAQMVAYTKPDGVDGPMKIWVPRRAKHLYMSPGMLDTTVAGGVKAGDSPLETIVHEADEEASLPASLVRESECSRGVLTCMNMTADGFPGEKGLVFPLVIHVFDVELPPDVIPTPKDDEVEGFTLMTVGQVKQALLNWEFKLDSAIVIIDFLIRHGFITAENEKNMVDINMCLHRRLPFRVTPSAETWVGSC